MNRQRTVRLLLLVIKCCYSLLVSGSRLELNSTGSVAADCRALRLVLE